VCTSQSADNKFTASDGALEPIVEQWPTWELQSNRSITINIRAVADLAAVVGSPAVNLATIKQRTHESLIGQTGFTTDHQLIDGRHQIN